MSVSSDTTPFINWLAGSQLTGDTVVFGADVWGDAKNSSIMFVVSFCFHADLLSDGGRVTTVSRQAAHVFKHTLIHTSARNGIVSLGIGNRILLLVSCISLTMLRNDYDHILSQIELFLVDEV